MRHLMGRRRPRILAVDANDIGAKVRKQHAAKRRRPEPRELDHAHARKRSLCHVHLPRVP